MSDIEDKDAEAPEFEIIVEDDTPDADKGRVVAPEQTESDDDIKVGDDEATRYNKDVQKRIKDLSFKAHSERRAKEAAARERDEAIRLAQSLIEKTKQLEDLKVAQEKALVEQAKGRSESQISLLKRAAKEAFEAGDTDKFLEFQEQLQRSVVENERYNAYRAPEPQPQVHQLPPPPPKPDAKAEKWYEANSNWFQAEGEIEEEMTAYAFGVSDILRKKNVDPRSDEYYQTIDERVRQRFPEYFGKRPESVSDATTKAPSVVAPANRAAKNTTRQVRLTDSQMKLIRKLQITPQRYVEEYMKVNPNG
jgi:DNA-binding PucR family transcriptional regulator